MNWIIFSILAMVVITGVRRMARENPYTDVQAKDPDTHVETGGDAPVYLDVQDTVQCQQCQAYIVKHAPSCGRQECPFGTKI